MRGVFGGGEGAGGGGGEVGAEAGHVTVTVSGVSGGD